MVNAAVVSACRGFFGCASDVSQGGDMIHFGLHAVSIRAALQEPRGQPNGMHRKCKRQDELSLLSQEDLLCSKDIAKKPLGYIKV